ncbi:MAG: UvrD-helicase domain-containing protein, partial [Treponema sp.]|nr:UvrD-helicase domain-containing protein [Treponema sp.]
WLKTLREHLDDAEAGFYTLKAGIRRDFERGPALIEGLPEPPGAEVPRFVLTGEISTIYKKEGKTRKVHHLVILSNFTAAAAFQTALERIGNIRSDGRPILGMDSRDLLALLLEVDPQALLIPAHIWTPWFSALGAQSGFDSIAACYEDLTPYIPAIETGLSSNPPMNWALKSLDPFSIISNSDAHAPEKLGREGTVFAMDMGLPSLTAALRRDSGEMGVLETIEFFPQEGKYHYDGHRKCAVYLSPEEAAGASGICPVCHKPLTRGVMGRVLELADFPVDEWAACPADYTRTNRRPYRSLIPLKELLGELLEVGSASKKVETAYRSLIEQGGSELSLLMDMPQEALEDLAAPGLSGERLALGIHRMRRGAVSIHPGYDGEYGIIRAFPPGEVSTSHELPGIAEIRGTSPAKPNRGRTGPLPQTRNQQALPSPIEDKPLSPQGFIPQPEQEQVIGYEGKYALIIAGPGSGKTATLAARIARLVQQGTPPETILAVTFTVKAAWELRERIMRTIGNGDAGITASTFHGLCASILREQRESRGMASFSILTEAERDALLQELGAEQPGPIRPQSLGKYIETRKRFLLLPGEERPNRAWAELFPDDQEAVPFPQVQAELEYRYHRYQQRLRAAAALDFEDLLIETVGLLVKDPAQASPYQGRFRHIFVDEYQDINFAQYVLIRLLAAEGRGPAAALWVIGDPNQAIYRFRGSDTRFIDRFGYDYPQAARFQLTRSFRCAKPISNAAGKLMCTSLIGTTGEAHLFRAAYPTEKSEAEGIARRIGRLIGGTTFFALDSAVAGEGGEPELRSLGDCAILLRTLTLAAPITKALGDHGIPFIRNGEKPWWEQEPISSLLGILRNSWGIAEESPSPAEAVKRAWKGFPQKRKTKQAAAHQELVDRLISIAEWYATLPEFLDTLAVSDASSGGDTNGMEPGREGVQIMSIHASKGLEFDHVFVPALEDGLLPFTLYEGNEEKARWIEKIEEEKRLLYVAMTRARVGLYLSSARKRTFQGRKLENPSSPFLDVLESLIPLYEEQPSRRLVDIQLRLF